MHQSYNAFHLQMHKLLYWTSVITPHLTP